jgi:hypothetical protein
MYANSNPKSKKELRERVAAAIAAGRKGEPCHQPGPFGPGVRDGEHVCEGPHYPQPHRWYARVRVEGGLIVKVIS